MRSVAPPASRIASLGTSCAWRPIASPAACWTIVTRRPSIRSSSSTTPWPATQGVLPEHGVITG